MCGCVPCHAKLRLHASVKPRTCVHQIHTIMPSKWLGPCPNKSYQLRKPYWHGDFTLFTLEATQNLKASQQKIECDHGLTLNGAGQTSSDAQGQVRHPIQSLGWRRDGDANTKEVAGMRRVKSTGQKVRQRLGNVVQLSGGSPVFMLLYVHVYLHVNCCVYMFWYVHVHPDLCIMYMYDVNVQCTLIMCMHMCIIQSIGIVFFGVSVCVDMYLYIVCTAHGQSHAHAYVHMYIFMCKWVNACKFSRKFAYCQGSTLIRMTKREA
jgi:hypothetical protein